MDGAAALVHGQSGAVRRQLPRADAMGGCLRPAAIRESDGTAGDVDFLRRPLLSRWCLRTRERAYVDDGAKTPGTAASSGDPRAAHRITTRRQGERLAPTRRRGARTRP